MFYTVKTPWLLKKFYPSLIWEIPTKEKTLYLTFDDGPHTTATPFVLDELKKYHAKATFFCIGKNVVERNEIYQRILKEGHKTGNHTFNHLNGWKTNDQSYFENISEASKCIKSNLFRPPYGKITKSQISNIKSQIPNLKIIMWSLLSGDFDESISPERCLQNVITNAKPGNIIVFHDSSKAWSRMSFALSKTLEYFSGKGFRFLTL